MISRMVIPEPELRATVLEAEPQTGSRRLVISPPVSIPMPLGDVQSVLRVPRHRWTHRCAASIFSTGRSFARCRASRPPFELCCCTLGMIKNRAKDRELGAPRTGGPPGNSLRGILVRDLDHAGEMGEAPIDASRRVSVRETELCQGTWVRGPSCAMAQRVYSLIYF